MNAGGVQARVGSKNRFGGGAVFFGNGVDGFAGADDMGGGSLGAKGSPSEHEKKKKSQVAHGDEISCGERATG